jgi:two-component system KDP operon response regulator KdpE
MTPGRLAPPNGGAHVLLVEDDDATRISVAANLSAHGYRVTEAADVRSATHSWEMNRPDVILLDLGLPDADGLVLIRRVRRDATTPILVLSARDAEPDKVTALETGADDYVTKPFGLPELRARVGALLRRSGGPASDAVGQVTLGPIVIDVTRRTVVVANTPIELTPREYELLKTLISQPGRLLTRGRLLRAVWGAAYGDEAHYLHVYVSRLRRKLDGADPTGAASALIVAEPGVGYRIAEASEPST